VVDAAIQREIDVRYRSDRLGPARPNQFRVVAGHGIDGVERAKRTIALSALVDLRPFRWRPTGSLPAPLLRTR